MRRYSIYLSGGQTIVIRARDLQLRRNHLGAITDMTWHGAVDTIQHLNPQHVSAIVEGLEGL